MRDWLKRRFQRRPKKDDRSWEEQWDARQAALESVLGKAENTVYHALIPLYLGGFADVLRFRNYIDGVAYATADLTGDSSQIENELGNYELMICMREESNWACGIMSKLARYTLESKLSPGETMDIGPATPDGSSVSAFLFCRPELSHPTFTVQGVRCGLLLCIGITDEEIAVCKGEGSKRVLTRLKEAGIFPFTDLNRASVV